MRETKGCPVSYHFDTFVHGVSLIACKLKNCWKFIPKVTHSVKIFYLGSKTRMEINVDVFVNLLNGGMEPAKLAINHLHGLKGLI